MKRVGIKLDRGFTIVEIVIVISIIAILAIITTVGYLSYQNQAASQKIGSLASRIAAGAEKYYDNNNEYPGGGQLFIATPQVISQTLGISTEELNQPDAKFTFCFGNGTGSCNSPKSIYYTPDPWDTTTQSYNANFGSCSFTFTAPTPQEASGFSAYVIWYQDPSTSKWVYKRSNRGPVSISGTGCAFSTNS